ncbi:MAG: ATP-binding protein [bacterium]|nr:ATP-binding protein [bacterium]
MAPVSLSPLLNSLFFDDFFRRLSRVCSTGALAIGLAGLLGWILDLQGLKSLLPDQPTLKFNTALCFVFSGLGLVVLHRGTNRPSAQRVMMILALLVLLISGLTIFQHVSGLNLGIDELFFRDLNPEPGTMPGRMPIGTSLALLLNSLALVILNNHRYRAAQVLVLLSGSIGLIALLGHLYRGNEPYKGLLSLHTSMALHTALGLILLSLAVVSAYPSKGVMRLFTDAGAGGIVSRRLVPAMTLTPIILGGLIVVGTNAGWYDRIVAYDLLVVSTIIALGILALRNAATVHQADIARQEADLRLLRLNRAFQILSACNQALVRAEDELTLLEEVCRNITSIGGYVLAWVGLLDNEHTPRLTAGSPVKPEEVSSHIAEITQKVLSTHQPQVVHALKSTVRWDDASAAYDSMIALPIRDRDTVLGCLYVYSSAEDGFDAREIALLNELASDLGFGLVTLRRRHAFQASQEQVTYQARLLENVSDAVIGTNLEFVVQSWNKAAEEIYGYTREEALGRTINQLLNTRIIDDSAERVLAQFREFGLWRGDAVQQRKDGAKVRVLSSVSWITDSAGTLIGAVAVNRDVTQVRQLEEQQRQAELLRHSLEKERELLKARETFIATVSHDFRTPLAVIQSSSEMLLRYREKFTPEKRDHHSTVILDQVRYMTSLLDDVLLLSRAKAGKLEYKPVSLNLDTYCQALFEKIQGSTTPAHRFRYVRQGDLQDALIDEKALQRVLANLLSNAIKYSPQGGEVRLELQREGDNVVFTIADQGIGIPPEDRPYIFDLFHRAANTHHIEGTGLGMAIAYENVLHLGGSITFESEVGKGTTFTVRLPYQHKAKR